MVRECLFDGMLYNYPIPEVGTVVQCCLHRLDGVVEGDVPE
jgi:hypothetical protein